MGKHLVIELNPPAPKSPVKTSDINSKTTTSAAKQKAAEFVRALKTITSDTTPQRHTAMWHIGVDINGAITRGWSANARNAFMFHLGEKFGGVSAFRGVTLKDFADFFLTGVNSTVLTIGSASDLQAVRWANAGLAKPYDDYWLPADATVVVPLSLPKEMKGYSITYQMQAMHEAGVAKGSESYVDVYVSTEAKFPGIPLIKDILSIDIRAGAKKGKKTYTKVETKDAVRSGAQVSMGFTLQEVTRNSVVVVNQPHAKWDYLTVEKGWQIVPKEGGPTLGPFWPHYRLDGTEIPNVTFTAAADALEKTIEKAAVEVAKLFTAIH